MKMLRNIWKALRLRLRRGESHHYSSAPAAANDSLPPATIIVLREVRLSITDLPPVYIGRLDDLISDGNLLAPTKPEMQTDRRHETAPAGAA